MQLQRVNNQWASGSLRVNKHRITTKEKPGK